MPLPKFLKDAQAYRAININPHGILNHTDQDHMRLANAVLEQAVKDLRSDDADIYGPAWDFLTGATVDDREMLNFWAANARMDVNILTQWAHRHETQKLTEYRALRPSR